MSTPPAIERRPLLAAALPDWWTTKVDVRAIRFGPGQTTGLHSHPGQVVGYIAAGAAILQIEGRPAQRLETGAAFHEPAGARILQFDNASGEDPLEFVAIYLLQGDQPLIEMLG